MTGRADRADAADPAGTEPQEYAFACLALIRWNVRSLLAEIRLHPPHPQKAVFLWFTQRHSLDASRRLRAVFWGWRIRS